MVFNCTISVPQNLHHLIAGKGGKTIRSICSDTGAQIQLPETNSQSDEINLTAKIKSQLRSAKYMIEDIVDDFIRKQKAEKDERDYYNKMKQIEQNRLAAERVELSKQQTNQKISDSSKIKSPQTHHQTKVSSQLIKQSNEKQSSTVCSQTDTTEVTKQVKSLTSSSMRVPFQFHHRIIGKGGVTVKYIRSESGAEIRMPDKNSGSDEILLTGSKAAILIAEQMIQDHVDSCQRFQREREIELEHQQKMRECENARIVEERKHTQQIKEDARKRREQEHQKRKDIELGRLKAFNNSEKSSNNFEQTTELSIKIPSEYHSKIIGKSGSGVRHIRDNSGAKIKFPECDSGSDDVILSGSKYQIARAKEMIDELIDFQHKIENDRKSELQLQDQFKLVEKERINAEREFNQKMDNESRLELNKVLQEIKSLQINEKLEKERYDEKLQMIEKSEQQKQIEITLYIPTKFHHCFIGKEGVTIKRIRIESGVTIKIPERDCESEDVLLSGTQSQISRAQQMIDDEISVFVKIQKDRESELQFQNQFKIAEKERINAEREFNQKMEKESRLELQKVLEEIKTQRINEKLEKDLYAEKLQKIGKSQQLKQIETYLKIPRNFHHCFIGKEGAAIKRIRIVSGATIKIPERDSESDDVILSGTQSQISQAQQMIEDEIDAFVKIQKDRESELQFQNQFKLAEKERIYAERELNQKIEKESRLELQKVLEKIKTQRINEQLEKDLYAEKLQKIGKSQQLKQIDSDMKIPRNFHHCFIGKEGAAIKRIRIVSGATIKIPERGSESEDVILSGTQSQISQAQQMIEDEIDAFVKIQENREAERDLRYQMKKIDENQVTRQTNDIFEFHSLEVNKFAKERDHCFSESQKAWDEDDRIKAKFEAEKGRNAAELMKRALKKKAFEIFQFRNSSDISRIDLHGLLVQESVDHLEIYLDYVKNSTDLAEIQIVVGAGNHSSGNNAKIKPRIEQYLNEHKMEFSEVNVGCFSVKLLRK